MTFDVVASIASIVMSLAAITLCAASALIRSHTMWLREVRIPAIQADLPTPPMPRRVRAGRWISNLGPQD